MRQPFYKVLYVQVLLAIAAGVLLGHLYPQYATAMKPLGDAFIRLIRMIIGPVIFCTVVTGISSMSDLKKVGRVGGKALVYFEVVSSIALAIGLLAGHVLHPGDGFNVLVASLDTRAIAGFVSQSEHLDGLTGFLFGIIPVSFFDAFAKGDTLPILFVSIMFGIAISAAGEQASGVTAMIEKLSAVFFSLVKIITKAAPAGAFGAISFTVGKYGIASLIPLFKLILTFYVTAFIFVAVVLGTVARMAGFSVFRLLAYLKDELLIVLGTSTSEAVLPQLMQKLERLGCSKAVVGLVVPTGYSFNLDGANIYMTLAVLFLAQATNIHLTTGQELTLLAVTMLTSKGCRCRFCCACGKSCGCAYRSCGSNGAHPGYRSLHGGMPLVSERHWQCSSGCRGVGVGGGARPVEDARGALRRAGSTHLDRWIGNAEWVTICR
ncbi:aerobic C4-dicarboxylate transport protein [Paraburkholderia sp. GAS448]